MTAELLATPWLLLGAFILFAYAVEAMTGFGSIVISLSLGALLLPIPALLPVLVPLNIGMTGYLACKYRHHIHMPTLWRVVLPLMALGTLAGYGLRPWLDENLLKHLLGVLILWFAGRALWQSLRATPLLARSRGWTRFWTFAAGITHGLFASGGPLLVYALAGVDLDKARFRATLVVVWFCLNGALTFAFALDGTMAPALGHIALYLPLLILGVLLGERLHHRIDELRFRRAVYAVLLMAGLALAWPR
jgi:hypothetical protein